MIILDEKTFTYLYIVIPALLKQGKRSINDDTYQCRYRGPDNTCCAVGFYIPEIEYKPELEGKPCISSRATFLITDEMLKISTIKDLHPKILNHVQHIHDRVFPENWEEVFFQEFPEVMQLLKLDGLV